MSEQNYKAFWDEALKMIHEEYNAKGQENEFQLWFNMEYVEDTLKEITVSVPSDFMWKSMTDRGYVKDVTDKINEITGQNINLKYIVKAKNSSIIEDNDSSSENYSIKLDNTEKNIQTEEIKPKISKHPQLNENFIFDSFIVGDENRFAYSVALSIAKNPATAYNPTLIYGGVGLGKTHLMQSIGNYLHEERGDKYKICYISAENFLNDYTNSLGKINGKTIDKFKAKYRNVDLLLLDDIHFIQGKKNLQEEIFYTFEALFNNKKQMVFTCDRPLSELKDVESRLISRFNRGICVDLKLPNYETRKAILIKKLSLINKYIPEEIIDFIARNVQTSIRDLEGCLTKMIAYSELVGKNLTIEIAQDQLKDVFNQPFNGSITIETIQKVVAEHYNISVSDIKGKKREKKYVIPRQIAIYLAREITEYSFPELGNEFGGRDHTTAMHSHEKVEQQLKTDSSLNSVIELLKREIKEYKKI
jgi:chromosomal replication initiator protein